MSRVGEMRGVVLTGHGGLDKLVYREDMPIPRPLAGEVLIRVAACGLNNTDLNTRVGWYGSSVASGMTFDLAIHGLPSDAADMSSWDRKSLHFPLIQGAAAAGTIVDVGAGVDPSRVGQRVVIDPVVRSPDLPLGARGVQYVGSERDGGYAEFLVVPTENALRVAGDLDFKRLSTLPCAYQTAEEMQIRADVQPPDTVVVTGASGGVGLANVQLAKLRGATVIAICSRSKQDRVRRHGADEVLAREDGPVSTQLSALLGDRGANVILDVVGTDDVATLWSLLARGGRYATGGAIAGPFARVDLRDLIYKDLKVFGIANPEPQAMRNLVSYVEDGRLAPVVDKTFPLKDLAQAQREFAHKEHVGKIVIEIASN